MTEPTDISMIWNIGIVVDGAYVPGGRDEIFHYASKGHPKSVMSFLEETVRNLVSSLFHDGDNAYYDLRWELDDPYNPACHYLAYDHDENGPFICGGSAYAMIEISI